MNQINEKLASIGCGITDLPEQIQQRIQSIEKLQVQLDEAKKEYDENPTEEVSEKLEDVTNFKDGYIEETLDIIDDWDAWRKEQVEKEKANADKTKVVESTSAPVEETKPVSKVSQEEKPKKKGIGLGGIILGVAVLAITMGAVNVMKDK